VFLWTCSDFDTLFATASIPETTVKYTHLIQPEPLAALLATSSDVVVLDCSSDLSAPDSGRLAYEAQHIPGARYVSMKDTLSGTPTGRNGRNPLPDAADFRRSMEALGIGDDTQVVAYDNGDGLYACRLWWMLKWIGHVHAAVLDGGLAAWNAAGQPVTDEIPGDAARRSLSVREALAKPIGFTALRDTLPANTHLVVDARPAARFAGEGETLDARGGHIPGARNRWFKQNLGPDGRFKSPEQLHGEFSALLGDRSPADVVNQCGSGVSACHNLLAMELAGLSGSQLYVGSWSEWCVQDNAPIAQGPD
jgi:thiosulfate/3-mercaptopyruvate sulfurtransferase